MPRGFSDRGHWGAGKPTPAYTVELDSASPLSVGLRLVALFDGPAASYPDLANVARRFSHIGAVTVSDSDLGAVAWTTLTSQVAPGFSPAIALSPSESAASSYTVSAMVRFDGTVPSAGAYGSSGAGICTDGQGFWPLFLSVASPAFAVQNGSTNSPFSNSAGAVLRSSSLSGWHQLTVVCQAGGATLYVDGGGTFLGSMAVVASGPPPVANAEIGDMAIGVAQVGTPVLQVNPLPVTFSLASLLGGSGASGGAAWPWPTADVMYWNRALSAGEIAGHTAARWTSVLRPRFSTRWEAVPGGAGGVIPPPPPPPPGMGPTLAGVGALTATAIPQKPGSNASILGTGFIQASGAARAIARATLGGTGGLSADARVAKVINAISAVGGVTATARVIAAASSVVAAAGSAASSAALKDAQARAAALGAGTLTGDAIWVEGKGHGHATISVVGSLTASGISSKGSFTFLNGSGGLSVIPSLLLQQHANARAVINVEGFIHAQAFVLRAPSVLPVFPAGSLPGFFAVELETFIPGFTAVNATEGHGTRAHGTLSQHTQGSPELTTILRVSDMGYVTRPSDANGPTPYPALLDQAFQINAQMNLDPNQSPAAAAWGNLLLINTPSHWLDGIANTQNCDGRTLRILRGQKQWDMARQYMTDPPYSSLTAALVGLGTSWILSETELQVPIRDASYFLEPVLASGGIYGGTGKLDGTLTLATRPFPYARGGSAANPISNISPVLVDPVALIYQYNSGGVGSVTALYEAGAAVFTYAGDVPDLYAGATPAGSYRTNNTRSLLQLGSVPVGAITADVTAAFTTAGPQSNPFRIARYILAEDIGMPPSMIDVNSFEAAANAYPTYSAGVFFDGSSAPTGLQAIETVFAGIGAAVVPFRDGTLHCVVLRAIAATEPVMDVWDKTSITQMVSQTLPATLDPPRFRFQIGWGHNYTQQTSGLNPTTTAARQQYLAVSDRFASWSSPTIIRAYRRPNDPGQTVTALTGQADAQAVANDLGALWGIRRRLYQVSLPIANFSRNIGDVVQIKYPIEDLATGRLGRIVGYSLKSTDSSVAYSVLV